MFSLSHASPTFLAAKVHNLLDPAHYTTHAMTTPTAASASDSGTPHYQSSLQRQQQQQKQQQVQLQQQRPNAAAGSPNSTRRQSGAGVVASALALLPRVKRGQVVRVEMTEYESAQVPGMQFDNDDTAVGAAAAATMVQVDDLTAGVIASQALARLPPTPCTRLQQWDEHVARRKAAANRSGDAANALPGVSLDGSVQEDRPAFTGGAAKDDGGRLSPPPLAQNAAATARET